MGRRQRNGSLGLDENVAVLGVQHTLADELLGDGDGDVVGHTQVREVVQEPGVVTAGVGRGLRGWSLVGMKPPPPQLAAPAPWNQLLLLLLLLPQSLGDGHNGFPAAQGGTSHGLITPGQGEAGWGPQGSE